MTSDLDVVIVTYNSAHVIGALLDSIPGALGDTLKADIVVVDNGSNDSTVAFLRSRGGCRVVEAENLGYSAGINRGVRASSGNGPILILNPDVRLGESSIPEMFNVMKIPATGIVAPSVWNGDGTRNRSLRRTPTLLRATGLAFTGKPAFSEHVTENIAYEQINDCDWALGAVLLVDRRCHQELGGWDESFFLYSEETDFCLRARDRGWFTRYAPAAEVVHIGGESGRSPRIHSMQIVNKVRLYRRRHGAAVSWVYYALTVASELSWLVRGQRESRTSLLALLRPSRRPPEIGCSRTLMPR